MSNITTKPLVRYPGSKAKKTKKLTSMFPQFTGTFFEPFIGSGVVSIYQGELNPDRKIWINDIYPELFNLWTVVQQSPEILVKMILEIRRDYPPDKVGMMNPLYEDMKKLLVEGINIERAAAFFVLNKISFSGMGGKSEHNYQHLFNDDNTRKLLTIGRIIKNYTITNIDYGKVLENVKKDDFVFLDPPYDIKDMLYGEGGEIHAKFSHTVFLERVKALPCNWLITYNDNDLLRDWYKDYYIRDEEYRYCMEFSRDDQGNAKTRMKNELIISNYDIKDEVNNSAFNAFFG